MDYFIKRKIYETEMTKHEKGWTFSVEKMVSHFKSCLLIFYLAMKIKGSPKTISDVLSKRKNSLWLLPKCANHNPLPSFTHEKIWCPINLPITSPVVSGLRTFPWGSKHASAVHPHALVAAEPAALEDASPGNMVEKSRLKVCFENGHVSLVERHQKKRLYWL